MMLPFKCKIAGQTGKPQLFSLRLCGCGETVDALALGASFERSVGSNPTIRTNCKDAIHPRSPSIRTFGMHHPSFNDVVINGFLLNPTVWEVLGSVLALAWTISRLKAKL